MTSYPDVPDTHWAFHAISTLNNLGVLEGFADGNFHGAKPMSRYEFAVALARIMRLPG
ncbi:MAG: trimeric autotransporter adhesin [Abditibacteriota bacterium]|nr:trimeric autotransporter adhesin [Abditibacteriota bacterium]